MANVHEVDIKGALAFDANGDDKVLKLLGWLSLPSVGFKLEWSNEFRVPNHHGGETTFTRFAIYGSEAASSAAILQDLEILQRAGTIYSASYKDIENDGGWIHVNLHERRFRKVFNPMNTSACRFCKAASDGN